MKTVTVKISKAVARSYKKRELAGYPVGEGLHQVEEGTACSMRQDAYECSLIASNPAVKAAFGGLFRQLDKGLGDAGKDESLAEVSQRNIGEFVKLESSEIVVLPQVRTSFENESLSDLAEDIKAIGLIHPITVRPGQDGKYILITGERRVKACELAGVDIVAKVVDADDAWAKRIQLAENVHREELDLKDKARAVRQLYDELGTMQAVADLVKKSKSWVSKLVAITEKDFGWRAQNLLSSGECEDFELLGTLSKIEKSCTWMEIEEAFKRFDEGKMNREKAREFLNSHLEAKAKLKARKEEQILLDEAEYQESQTYKAEEKTEQIEQAQKQPVKVYLSPEQALLNLVKFYAQFEVREFEGDRFKVATEISTVPYIREGVVNQAWRDALDSLAAWGEPVMTEEYFRQELMLDE